METCSPKGNVSVYNYYGIGSKVTTTHLPPRVIPLTGSVLVELYYRQATLLSSFVEVLVTESASPSHLASACAVEVCFPSLALDQHFTYSVENHRVPLLPGMRVEAPLRKGIRLGFIVSIGKLEQPEGYPPLKPILRILDQQPLFPRPLWKVLLFTACYYQLPLNALLYYLLPATLLKGTSIPPYTRRMWVLNESASSTSSWSAEKLRYIWQKELAKRLQAGPIYLDSVAATAQEEAQLRRWLRKQLVQVFQSPHSLKRWISKKMSWNPPTFEINAMQTEAIHKVLAQWNRFAVFLLYGVTGSGKSEVYFALIRQALANGQRVLYLAPEIGLLAPIEAQLYERFSESTPIITIHSNRTTDAKWLAWQSVHAGACGIILGTRSALFMPIENCGLIIIDEEHDTSYQQTEPFPYHARSLGIMLAKYWNCPILLGSATPAFESVHAVRHGRYVQLELPHRTNGQPLPRLQIVDLNQEKPIHGLSIKAVHIVKHALAQGDQVLFFLNRRGYAPVAFCTHCQEPLRCFGCQQPYSVYLTAPTCRCHRCCRARSLPLCCPTCKQETLITVGIGTEQLEEIVKSYFPKLPVTRIDRDSVTHPSMQKNLLKELEKPGPRIIVATQMFSKGYHFPRLTTAVICAFDQAFFSTDFRALEHLAQLCTQVAGRTGRGDRRGLVLLQTYQANHPFFEYFTVFGYTAFVNQQLLERQAAKLPPFSAQALFIVETRMRLQGEHILTALKELLLNSVHLPDGIRFFGPLPALYAQRNSRFRWQLLVEHASRKQLQLWLVRVQPLLAAYQQKVKAANWQLIVDPVDFS